MSYTVPGSRLGVLSLLRVPFDPLTYRSLGYLLLSMPLAILYLVILTTGLTLSLALAVVLIGPVVFVVTLLLVLGLAQMDGVLAAVLLGADIQPEFPSHRTLPTFVKELVLGSGTWLAVAFLVWKILLGFLAGIVLLLAIPISGSLLLAPFYWGETVVIHSAFGTYGVDSAAKAILASTLGVGIAFGTLLLVHAIGVLSREVAEGMLTH